MLTSYLGRQKKEGEGLIKGPGRQNGLIFPLEAKFSQLKKGGGGGGRGCEAPPLLTAAISAPPPCCHDQCIVDFPAHACMCH